MTQKDGQIRIHFVCTGNIYRSRLAEAYLRSKGLEKVTISSSGTQASIQNKGTITWQTQRLLYRHDLLPYMTETWTETTPELLTNIDLVVFMGKANFGRSQKWLPDRVKCEIWELPDFDDRDLNGKPLDIGQEIKGIIASEEIFAAIVKKVDELVKSYKLDGGKAR